MLHEHATIVSVEQRSAEWFTARAGRLTGSSAGDMLATIKYGEAAARRDLRTRLLCERMTGQSQQSTYKSGDMQWGTDLEPEARAVYASLSGFPVRSTGFISRSDLLAGCSVDGDVDDFSGIIEIKCPKSATHLKYLKGRELPREYHAQVTHNLWVTGADWCDFLSYDPRFPQKHQVFRVRVHSEGMNLAAYELAVRLFLREVDAEMDELEQLGSVA